MTINSVGIDHRLVITEGERRSGHAFAMMSFSGALPPAASGRWCRVVVTWPGAGVFWAKLELSDSARGQIVREAFFPRGQGADKVLLVHAPHASGRFCLSVFMQCAASLPPPALSLQVLSRQAASLRLLAGGGPWLASALHGSPLGLLGRLRAMLGQGAARRGEAPPYDVWIDLYDTWGEQERKALLAQPDETIGVCVLGTGSDAVLGETRASIATQWRKPDTLSILRTHGDRHVPVTDWVVIVACGEILAQQTLACFARAARRDPSLLALYADIDYYDTEKKRSSPGFRSSPDPWLIRSEILRDGAWMFRRSALGPEIGPLHDDNIRLALARGLPAERIQHIPLILTHCPLPKRLIERPATALQQRGKSLPHVTIIVPSACRSWHVLRCLRSVALGTNYAAFDILVAVSCRDPDDRQQGRIMQHVSMLPRVKMVTLAMPDFNFAAVINRAAAQATGDLLLLLNDDVSPITPDWLQNMVVFTEGAGPWCADIVGPRLLYGNGLVQHGGVIMGLANLCEHAFRLAPGDDAGPQGVARLDRQVSAVTAACMLVRRALFEALNGMDEGFAIALNDVDFCLRAGEAGARIVFAAGVDLYHFESLSLGRHYQGARAGLEAAEVTRLRDRWTFRILADPFYNPCASLELGREFTPGFPPRQTPHSWIGQEAPAPH